MINLYIKYNRFIKNFNYFIKSKILIKIYLLFIINTFNILNLRKKLIQNFNIHFKLKKSDY